MWKIFDYTESKYFYTVICVYLMQYNWAHTEFEWQSTLIKIDIVQKMYLGTYSMYKK